MTIHVKTRVLAGNRIEVSADGLREGEDVEVTIKPVQPAEKTSGHGLLEWLDSLPSRKTPEEWEQFEREFQEERNSWDK